MRALITGGSGFIGNRLCSLLKCGGWEVVSVDDHRVEPLGKPVAREFRMNVSDITAEHLTSIDVVYHLASWKNVPLSYLHPLTYLDNVEATANLLKVFRASSAKRLIIGSTCEVFGRQLEQPIKEDAKLAPLSPYAMSKCISEHYADIFRSGSEKEIGIVRIFNTYGPYERPDAVVPAMCKSALLNKEIKIEGDGSQSRDMTYIDDMVVKLAEMGSAVNLPEKINLGSGKCATHSIEDIALEVRQSMKRYGYNVSINYTKPRKNEIYTFQSDLSKQIDLDISKSKVSLDQGIELTLNWWKDRLNY